MYTVNLISACFSAGRWSSMLGYNTLLSLDKALCAVCYSKHSQISPFLNKGEVRDDF